MCGYTKRRNSDTQGDWTGCPQLQFQAAPRQKNFTTLFPCKTWLYRSISSFPWNPGRQFPSVQVQAGWKSIQLEERLWQSLFQFAFSEIAWVHLSLWTIPRTIPNLILVFVSWYHISCYNCMERALYGQFLPPAQSFSANVWIKYYKIKIKIFAILHPLWTIGLTCEQMGRQSLPASDRCALT